MSEKIAVQYPLIKYAREIGWDCIRRSEALNLRGGDANTYFKEVVGSQLLNLNPDVINAERAAEIIRQLNLLSPTIEGNREALTWLRGERSVFVPEENRERNVRLIDFDNPSNNIFQVTYEWSQKNLIGTIRTDIVFLINGIPIAIAETKSASKPEGLAEGIDQIRRYHRESPELFVPTQVFEVTHLIDFYYGVTWSTNRKNIFNWREEGPGDFERKVKAFFDRARFLKVLHDYIIFLSKDDVLTKVILRQHQTRAVEKVIDRVHDPTKRRGLIWHTQGSGKTYTMITIASKLLREVRGEEKPSVLMLIDRNELEAQLFKNIDAYGVKTVEIADSKADLQRILRSDYRGLIVSMIHKFDGIPPNINRSENLVVLVDEAHRTTGGDLGNYLLAALPNATYIGFTGTPIDNISRGKGTFKVFGGDDEQGYLDKYSIAESIEDGTTVMLNYAIAPSDMLVDTETLEREFFGLKESEGISDVEELNGILNRAVKLKEMMKSSDRIDKIAEYVATHFTENVEPMGFKAFLVGVDREACALYKEALDTHLPSDYSQVVFSPAHNDSERLKRRHLTEDEEKAVRKAFLKKEGNPKILIVTEKLLTGFDAPILYCMYLDKPMRDHVLLQAIARINRPYEDYSGLVKPFGFVMDFVGIFDKLKKALAFDSDVVASVIQNIDVLKQLFTTQMSEQAPKYMAYASGWDDKSKERAIEAFKGKDRREEFFKFFRQVQNLYDILSPDAFLRPYIKQYLALSELYALLRNAYANRVYVDREVTAKTKELLRKVTGTDIVDFPNEIYELGPKELAAIKKSDSPTTAKILNLKRILRETVSKEGGSKPFVLSIGERASALEQAYDTRIQTSIDALDGVEKRKQEAFEQETLREYEKLAQEYIDADTERRRLSLDGNTYAIYTVLKLVHKEDALSTAKAVDELFQTHVDYWWDSKQEAQLRAEIFKTVLPITGPGKMIEVTNTLLRLQRIRR
jgi:type I restriction enzyme R subunit